MKLLIKDSAELKAYLGFIDADLPFKNIQSDIINTTKEVIKLISQAVYDLAVLAYEKPVENRSEDEKDLIFAVAYPVAVGAYKDYAPNNDISHTNKGRHFRVEDKEQIAYEWMLERDNKALERRYYKALDDMIKYLDTKVAAWKETDTYKNSFNLFIRTTDDFDTYFPINGSRLVLIKAAPGIRRGEVSDIKPRLGTARYEELKTKLKAGDPVDEALVEKIKEALVYKAMSWAMSRYSAQLFPEGVLQIYYSDRATVKGKRPPVNAEAEIAALYFKQDYEQILLELETMVEALNPVVEEIDEELPYPYFDEEDPFVST